MQKSREEQKGSILSPILVDLMKISKWAGKLTLIIIENQSMNISKKRLWVQRKELKLYMIKGMEFH